MPASGGPVLDSVGLPGYRELRFRVRERSWSWLASSVWVRVWGPRDWKRERNLEAMVEAEGAEAVE